MSIFNSDLLNEYKTAFTIWHLVSKNDSYGGYENTWTEGATFDGILSEDNSTQSVIAGIEQKTQFFGLKVEREVPLDFHSIIQRNSDGRFFRVTSGETLKSPKMSALNMRILSVEAYEPTDFPPPEPPKQPEQEEGESDAES